MDIRSLALQAGVDHRGKQDMIDLKDPEILEKEREGYMKHVIFQVGMWVGHSNTFFPKQLVQLRVLYIFPRGREEGEGRSEERGRGKEGRERKEGGGRSGEGGRRRVEGEGRKAGGRREKGGGKREKKGEEYLLPNNLSLSKPFYNYRAMH